MKKEFEVSFVAHHIMNIESETEDEAREEAIALFDGFYDWEINVEEVENE